MNNLFSIIKDNENILYNLSISNLMEEAIRNNEGVLLENGAFDAYTGKYTGRSPNDKFIVDTNDIHNDIWWENNNSMTEDNFNKIFNKVLDYIKNKKLYIFNGFVGADPNYRYQVTVINEYAYQNAFVRQLFIRPDIDDKLRKESDFTLICVPNLKADPKIDGTNSEAFVILNFEKKMILIGGTKYSGEIKKSVFTMMNYMMLKKDVLPMHCSANAGKSNDTVLFFGLSGTGKTTLSTDEERFLIGDDEHGWSNSGIFNFEGGCYAKCINLSKTDEPEIWNAIRFGTILENVDHTIDGIPDYKSSKFTENTRAAYPLNYIPRRVLKETGRSPKIIFFLTADAFGVLPPVSKLINEQIIDFFLLGYTSKIPGTERGIKEPRATFSPCFGAPFLPSLPYKYAKLLKQKVIENNTSIYLINTGWIGGPYGIGNRINLKYTRAMVRNIINNNLKGVEFTTDLIFNLLIPNFCPDVPSKLLNPINTWSNKGDYIESSKNLLAMFETKLNEIKNVIH